MELRKYMEILWRRKWALTWFVAITVLSAFLFSYLVTPVYKSTAQVLIRINPQSGLISQVSRNFGALDYFNEDFVVGTMESLLESPPVVKRVIGELNLKNGKGELFEVEDFVDQNFIITMFFTQKGVSIENVIDSNVFEITGYSTDPEEAKSIANGLAEAFLQENYSRNKKTARLAQKVIEEKISQILKILREGGELNVKNEVLRSRYSALLNDLEMAKLAEKMDLANIEVIQSASISDNIENNLYFPMSAKTTFGLSLIMGVFVGILWVFLLEYLDDTLKTEEEVKEVLKQPVLGNISKSSRELLNIDTLNTNIPLLNNFLDVKSRLGLISSAKNNKVFSVVSYQKSDGKSIIAAFLAYLLSQAGEKVLLIEANLRRPSIGNILNLAKSNGLSNFLRGESSLEEIVVRTPYENLDVVLSGSMLPDSLKVIDSSKIAHLIESLKPKYDRIIFDTLALQEGNDAIEISTKVDGVVFVAVSEKTSQKKAQYVMGLIKEAKCEIVGVVLNKVRVVGTK